MTIQVLTSRDVQTTLNYFVPLDDEPPYGYVVRPPAGVAWTNVGLEAHSTVIHDARGRDDLSGLDVSGFQLVHYPSAEKDFLDEEKIKTVYYAEAEDILKKYTDAKRVIVFNHNLRWGPNAKEDRTGKSPHHGPYFQRVHADQTPVSAARRIKYELGDEAERLLKGRYRIINLWRPIANTVAHHPLAVADYRSINPDEDLVPTRHIYADLEGAIFNVKYNPSHKWYYFPDQTPDEVILMKCFDSDADKQRTTPHSAFHDNTSPADAPQRQSIEIRAIVFDTD